MIKYLLVILLVLTCGCTLVWDKQVKVGANGAKTKVYGTLKQGSVMYMSNMCVGTKCKVCK